MNWPLASLARAIDRLAETIVRRRDLQAPQPRDTIGGRIEQGEGRFGTATERQRCGAATDAIDQIRGLVTLATGDNSKARIGQRLIVLSVVKPMRSSAMIASRYSPSSNWTLARSLCTARGSESALPEAKDRVAPSDVDSRQSQVDLLVV